jgi:hypothetical protein
LDHFEGRSWRGWQHHVTLVMLAYAFLVLRQRQRRGKKEGSEVSLPEVLAEMQCLLWCWSGYCPICDRRVEGDPPRSDTG